MMYTVLTVFMLYSQYLYCIYSVFTLFYKLVQQNIFDETGPQTYKIGTKRNTLALNLTLFIALKMPSAYFACCIYSSALQTWFYHRNKHYEP